MGITMGICGDIHGNTPSFFFFFSFQVLETYSYHQRIAMVIAKVRGYSKVQTECHELLHSLLRLTVSKRDCAVRLSLQHIVIYILYII